MGTLTKTMVMVWLGDRDGKSCKGCLPDREKRRFHTAGLMRPIAALASSLKPDLTPN